MCACADSAPHSVSRRYHLHRSSSLSSGTSRYHLTYLLFLSLCLMLGQAPQRASSVPESEFFPFGASHGDNRTERTDDGGSGPLVLDVKFPFFGKKQSVAHVSNNGIITFVKQLLSYRPMAFPLEEDTAIVAPYWADVDISKNNESDADVWYRQTKDQRILSQATDEIRASGPAQKNFRAYWALIATWHNVGFYGAVNATAMSKRNTFQAVLVLDTTGRKSFVILNYAKIEWTTGANSQGDPSTGLGGTPAQAGFNAGNQINYYEIEGAGTAAVINLTQTSNVGIPGKWIFQINLDGIKDSCSGFGGLVYINPPTVSMLGGQVVTIEGLCVEPDDKVQARIEGGQELCCYVEEKKMRCVMPNAFDTGVFTMELNVAEQGWNHSGKVKIENLVDVEPQVIRHTPHRWVTNERVFVSWSQDTQFVDTEEYLFEILEYRMANDQPALESRLVRKISKSRSGRYNLTIPDTFEGLSAAVVRVTALVTTNCTNLGPSIYSDVFPVRYSDPSRSEEACLAWLASDVSLPPLEPVNVCPCTLRQADGDTAQFTADPLCEESSKSNVNCQYRPSAASECIKPNQDGSSQSNFMCCYDKNSGELLNAAEGGQGGTVERYNYRTGPTQSWPAAVPFFTYLLGDLLPYMHCCQFSDNSSLCENYFLERRPPVSCQGYETPAAAQAAGDPHIVTMDGLNYTFNGVGKFVLLRVKDSDAVVQVKAIPALNEQDEPQNATVFTGVAVRASNTSSLVEISLDKQESLGYSVLVDKERFDITSSTSTLSEMTLLSTGSNTTDSTTELTVVLDQVGLSVLVEVTPDLLNIMVIAGAQLKGQLEGLLGNYNGDKEDDLRAADGMQLSSSASMRDIHEKFGLTWEVCENCSFFFEATTSLDIDNTVSTLSNFVYMPIFLDEMGDESKRNNTQEICGTNYQCLFDYEVTGKEEIAKSTLKFNEKFEARKEELQPVIRCPYLHAIANGNRTLSGQKVGDTAEYVCSEGFILTNASVQTLMCLPTGVWNGSPPDCVEVLNPGSGDFPLLYVAVGAASGGFIVLVLFVIAVRIMYTRCEGVRISHKVESSCSDFDHHQIELPSLFPISDIPSPVFENPQFLSSLQKLSEKGAFQIPRPTYVDPNIYSEYF